jgi:ribosomal protein L12E/L44/L45/RPP1/RPP2
LPKPSPAPLDWRKVAQSGKVWNFIEGEDFKGKPETYRTRLKTAARKEGVDFESAVVEIDGKQVLKVLAFLMDAKPSGGAAAAASVDGETGGKADRERDGEKPREEATQYA